MHGLERDFVEKVGAKPIFEYVEQNVKAPHVIHDEISVEVQDVGPHRKTFVTKTMATRVLFLSPPSLCVRLTRVSCTRGQWRRCWVRRVNGRLLTLRRRFYTSLDGNQHGMAEYVDRMPQGQNDIYFITIPRKQWPVYDRPPLRAEVVSIESEAEFRILGALAHAGYMGKKFRRVGSPTPMTAL